jgi:hypothetical protein
MNAFLMLVLLSGLSTFSLHAEVTEAETGSLQTAVQNPRGQVTGALEVRPSFSETSSYTQDTAELGYRFSPNFSMDYTQYFNTSLIPGYNGTGVDGNLGMKFADGFLRARFNNVWQNAAKDLSLGFETRLYFPTNPDARNAGYIAGMRNYATLTKTFGPQFSITLQEIPIVYGFDRAGTYSMRDGKLSGSANPVFENRVYLIPSFNITKKLAFSFPILLNMTRNRAFDSIAANNDRWTFVLWTWPEITYAIAAKTTLGLAFMSENLATDNLSQLALGGPMGGISQGSTQFILRQDL